MACTMAVFFAPCSIATQGQAGDGEPSPHNVPAFVKEAALGGDGVTCAGSELTADHSRARRGVWYVSARTTENPRAR